MTNIEQKSTGLLIDELVTTCIKEYYNSAAATPCTEKEKSLSQRRRDLSAALAGRFAAIERQLQVGDLIAQLTSTLIQCWHAQEIVMSAAETQRIADAAKDAQNFNAKRNELIRQIDELFGETAITATSKTYG